MQYQLQYFPTLNEMRATNKYLGLLVVGAAGGAGAGGSRGDHGLIYTKQKQKQNLN